MKQNRQKIISFIYKKVKLSRVRVLTPSLNKSFKFQSDFPYNNSQIYLLQSIVNDITNDDERTFKKNDKNYVFTSSVNYPNNRNLVKQKVTFDEDLNLEEVIVLDSDEVPSMTLKVKDIDFSPSFKDNYFEIDEIMSTVNLEEETVETSAIDDVISTINSDIEDLKQEEM